MSYSYDKRLSQQLHFSEHKAGTVTCMGTNLKSQVNQGVNFMDRKASMHKNPSTCTLLSKISTV